MGVDAPARAARRLPRRLLDRLVWNPPARAWIGVVAFALIGIVAMQLWVVKVGVGIGRALEHTQLLQQENAVLAAEDSSLSSAERIERLALTRGMVPAPPGALHFDALRGPLDARLAAAALAKPTQAQAAAPAGATATGTEPGSTATSAGAEVGAATSATTSSAASSAGGATGAGTAAGAGAETGASATSGEAAGAATAQAPVAETPVTKTPVAEAPAATAPAATGGASEAASPQASAGGGVQAPGG